MSDAQNKSREVPNAQGSGSDTVSAAKISAGTSVGNVGESPMPHAAGTGMANEQSRHQDRSAQQGSGPTVGGQSMGDSLKQAAGGAQARASEAYESTTQWARDTYEDAKDWAADNVGSAGRRLGSGAPSMGGIQRFVMENPVMVGVAGLAAGLLLGALLPRTRRESEVFGPWADEVREQSMRYAHQLAQQGRELVEEALSNPQAVPGQEGGQGQQVPQTGMGPH